MHSKFWFEFLQALPSIPAETKPLLAIVEASPVAEELIIAQDPNQTLGDNNSTNGALGGLSPLLFFPVVIITVIFLILVTVFLYTRFYVIAPNNEALVRTGGVFKKEQMVILHGGCIVIPGFHEITRVSLREISIDVVRAGTLAVRTQDYMRANMRVTFYVCITPNRNEILTAAARLSKKGQISEENIKDALEKRADDAIRAAAKKKKLAELDSDKLGFADEVLNLIQGDLLKVGLTLNNIAISEIEESDTYDENNFFDAQGVRLRTETIQRSIQQKKEVELTTRVAIEQGELEAEKKSLAIKREQEDANITQQKEIELLKLAQRKELESQEAQQQREIQEAKDKEEAKKQRNKILQEQAVEEERIQKELAIQNSQIASAIALEEKNKELKVAQAVQKQEAEVAEIQRRKTIEASQLQAKAEIALAEQKTQITEQTAAIAIANKQKERLEAEALRAEAESGVITAQEVEAAERTQKLAVIVAQQDAQQLRIAEQNVVEIDVFRRRRQAESARQAAELEAESIRTLADANRHKAMAEAEGQKAIIEAQNSLSNANRTAELLKTIWPELVTQLPDLLKALAPQPGVLGESRIYSFPGLNGGSGGNNAGDINKLLLSTSGLTLLNGLLNEGKLGLVVDQVKSLLQDPLTATNSPPVSAPAPAATGANISDSEMTALTNVDFPVGEL
ncbi:flotillin family protein [Synechocystis sp. CS-94]|uniref:flotillin family protein n=1 Tax=unclassified Synechocystis TaxID=2640012 RepID=UPI000401DF85|nr:flotillin family protein [Synechocystis sp. CS-94]AIE73240.1 Inner membrane protein YqiK [Synechocystis sp. PCC 6714]